MEKQLKLKNKIFKILPKAAAAVAVTFQNPPFSPGRDHKSRHDNATRWHRHHANKGFSGPIVSMIPNEARRKPNGDRNGIDDQEPTSPKISCMGQIKNKKKQTKKANASSSTSRDIEVKNKHVSAFQRMLLHGVKPKLSVGRKSSASAPDQDNKDALADKAPRVSQMKRFASGRDAFANFDWKARQVAPEEMDDCYSDEDRVESDAEEEDEDVKIPFSAPILVGGSVGDGVVLNLKPRKEINLWKRRTMAPPRPLQLNIH